MVNMNGYVGIYMPNHHRAMSNSIVYEHILKAEEMLNRKLKDGEVVHHIDHNKTNNKYENLMVFKTTDDHNKFHSFGNAILTEDGSYICNETSNKCICPICGNKKDRGAKYCLTCRLKYDIKTKRPQKDILKKDLLDRNFVKIAKKYGVKDNTIRKWCKKYKFPYKTTELKQMTDEEILSL